MKKYKSPTTRVLIKSDIIKLISHSKLLKGAIDANIEGCSYDLRVGTIFQDGQVINATHERSDTPITLKPGEVISMYTMEELALPDDIMATAFARNGDSAKGLLVLNPGHVDPGYCGPLTIRAINLRKSPIVISRGMKIFTVVFQKLPQATTSYIGNLSRDDMEREFNARDVEVSPKSIGEIVILTKDAPYPSRTEIDAIISNHRMSRITMWSAIGGAFLGGVSIIIAVASLWRASPPVNPTVPQSLPIVYLIPQPSNGNRVPALTPTKGVTGGG